MANTASNVSKVPRRILGILLSSLSAGVVPRVGAPYIAIGRKDEIEALVNALDRVSDGEGSCKFIIGRYGSGKSFLIQLSRGYALDKGFITADCDLSPERKLSGGGGQGLATYRELMKNIASKTSPDGGALPTIISRWFTSMREKLEDEGFDPESEGFNAEFSKRITSAVRELETDVGGFDFGAVMKQYYNAYLTENDAVESACLRWFRGEYNTRTEARNATGLKSISIINDENWYDYLKLMSAFVRLCGYSGLYVCIDECVNLYKIPNRISRENNYEKILAMFNDTMQGRSPGLMIVFGGTPQFLEDTRRGLFSYEALRSRLSDGNLGAELRSLMQPVLRLRRLSDSELLALILRLTSLHGEYHKWEPRITDSEKEQFLLSCLSRAGADTMITPREVIRDYVTLLDLLLTNPEKSYADISSAMKHTAASSSASAEATDLPSDETEPAAKPVQSEAAPKKVTLDDLEF